MKTLLIFALSFGVSLSCFAQANYSQSHKEIEYHFGIIADSDYETISEIEKIKYELRQIERTYNKTINSNSQTTFETIILHDDNEQSWMNAAKRFVHTPLGIMLYNANDSLTQTVSYSVEQEADNQAISNDIASNGYHPGLTLFPTYSAEVETALINAGILVSKSGDTCMTLTYEDGTIETYNSARLTIKRIWTDINGIQNIETNGYIPYGENKGYLLQIRNRERFVQSVNGPCITETKFTYYTDYIINDGLELIERAMSNIIPPPAAYAINLFPNPNSGIFTVDIELPQNDFITQSTITNLISQSSFIVNTDNSKSFNVDMTAQPDGNYVIQIITDQTILNYNFIKSAELPTPY